MSSGLKHACSGNMNRRLIQFESFLLLCYCPEIGLVANRSVSSWREYFLSYIQCVKWRAQFIVKLLVFSFQKSLVFLSLLFCLLRSESSFKGLRLCAVITCFVTSGCTWNSMNMTMIAPWWPMYLSSITARYEKHFWNQGYLNIRILKKRIYWMKVVTYIWRASGDLREV